MTLNRTHDFANALTRLEVERDVDDFVADQFTDDAALLRPETDQHTGSSGAGVFWRQYLAQFDEIRSTFDRLTDTGELGVLEWTSTGRLAGGAAIEYRGVSVLDFGDDSRVARFVTYYDTRPFAIRPGEHGAPGSP